MRPFFSILGLQIPAFWLMMVLAVVTAFGMLMFMTRRTSLRADAFNFYFFALCGALAGAWLLHVVIRIPAIARDWPYLREAYGVRDALAISAQSAGGMVFYGGLLGALVMMSLYAHMFREPLLPYLDLFARIAPIAHAIGRVGCFMGGCCYGRVVTAEHPLSLLAVVYPVYSLAAPAGVPILAVPLIEVTVNLLIAFILHMYIRKAYARKPRGTGTVAGLYAMMYAAARFGLEFLRGDIVRGGFVGVSTSQWISIFVFLLGIWLFTYNKKTNGLH